MSVEIRPYYPEKSQSVGIALWFGILFMCVTHNVMADTHRAPLWGTMEFGSPDMTVLPKWQAVLAAIENESARYERCDRNFLQCDTPELLSWRGFMADMRSEGKAGLALLDDVNDFFNQWPYIQDIYNWDLSDYWASPMEFLEKSGDCEDYAIIKYVTLKQLGVDVSRLRIAVVKDTVRGIAHAVLAVYDDEGDVNILDSLMNEVLPQEALLQYTPYYTVNEHARWVHIKPIEG